MSPRVDRGETARAVGLLVAPGTVVELRAPKTRFGTQSGYFDDPRALVAAATELSGTVPGVYLTLNPVRPELLARAANRVERYARTTTTDGDVVARRWLPFDFDPKRPAGIGSTDAEHATALATATTIRDWLVDFGFPAGSLILADSGNGAHLLARIDDLPNDEASTRLVRRCIDAVALHCGTPAITIDAEVCNAARIWKLYGTLACKGDAMPDRPHRLARIVDDPCKLTVAPRPLLERLAASLPGDHESWSGTRGPGDFDVRAYLATHGRAIRREKPWGAGGAVLELDHCVFDETHDHGEAAILLWASGMLGYKCHHHSCQDRRWRDVRERLDPARPRAHERRAAEDPGTEEARQSDDAAERDRGEKRPLFIRACELSAPPITWCVEGLIAERMLHVLSGKDKRGKTLLALEIGRAVLRGAQLFGQFPARSGPVMAALLDDPLGLTLARLDQLGVRGSIDDFYAVDPTQVTDPRMVLDRLAQEAPAIKPVLVILDALYLFLPGGNNAGNDAASMRPLMVRLNHLVEETGAAVLVVAHDNKSGSDVAGSYVVRAMAKAVLRLTVPREQQEEDEPDEPTTNRRVLSLESKLVAASAHLLELHGAGDWRRLGDPKTVRVDDLRTAVRRLLVEKKFTGTAEEIAQKVGKRRDRVDTVLADLVAEGTVCESEQHTGKPGRPPHVYRARNNRPAGESDDNARDENSGTQPAEEPDLFGQRGNSAFSAGPRAGRRDGNSPDHPIGDDVEPEEWLP
jgi:hypothetical protein